MRVRKYYFFLTWLAENYSQSMQVSVNQSRQGDIFYLFGGENAHIFGHSRGRRGQIGEGKACVDGAVGELVEVWGGELKIEN